MAVTNKRARGKGSSRVETLRTYDDGTRTLQRTTFSPTGRVTQENFRAGKGTGRNASTGGAG